MTGEVYRSENDIFQEVISRIITKSHQRGVEPSDPSPDYDILEKQFPGKKFQLTLFHDSPYHEIYLRAEAKKFINGHISDAEFLDYIRYDIETKTMKEVENVFCGGDYVILNLKERGAETKNVLQLIISTRAKFFHFIDY